MWPLEDERDICANFEKKLMKKMFKDAKRNIEELRVMRERLAEYEYTSVLLAGTLAGTLAENEILREENEKYRKEIETLKSYISGKERKKEKKGHVIVINETPDDYKKITEPFIMESAPLGVKWIDDILEKKEEADRIVFEDHDTVTGFILLPDQNWDGEEVTDLHLLALPQDKSIRSLRDISDKNLPMLENIRDRGLAAISKKYGLSAGDLRIYVHYQPSAYHFHVHFNNVAYNGHGTSVGKAHLLDDIIDNVKNFGDFYQRKTLTYYLRENEKLYTRYQHAKKS